VAAKVKRNQMNFKDKLVNIGFDTYKRSEGWFGRVGAVPFNNAPIGDVASENIQRASHG